MVVTKGLLVPVFLAFLSPVLPLACSSAPPSAQAACQDLAKAQCAQLAKCDSVQMQIDFANDANACATQLAASCNGRYSFYGSGATSATVEACAGAIRGASCAQLGASLSACAYPPGTLANGASCANSVQCAGGECYFGSGPGGCGTCTQASSGPRVCRGSGDCPASQVCAGNFECVTPVGLGAACGPGTNGVCEADLTCVLANGDGGIGGTCASPPGAGAACVGSGMYVACANGLVCNGSGTCATPQFVALGGSCDSSERANLCAGGACIGGTCVAYAAVGANCGSPQSPPCGPGLYCSNGSCKLVTTQDKCGTALLDGG